MEKFIPTIENTVENKEKKDRTKLLKKHLQKTIQRLVLAATIVLGVGSGVEAQAQTRMPKSEQRVELKISREELLAKYKKNFELMSAEVQREKLREKLEVIKSKYGSVINDFLELRQVETDLFFYLEQKRIGTKTKHLLALIRSL